MKLTWQQTGIDLKSKSSGQLKTKCPKCSEQRKHKSDTCLSVNIDTQTWFCHNCGFKGTLNVAEKKTYVLPQCNLTSLSKETVSWFAKRGISESTLQYFKITESEEWMPEGTFQNKTIEAGKRKTINFNYYRDGSLVNIKYRDAKKSFRLVKDAELIFYNIDSIKGKSECLICEGEIDCMTFYQEGYYSAISVPNGASKSNSAQLTYLDNNWELFESMEKIYIATDNDEAGIYLRNELIRRLGADRCFIVSFGEYKDANEYLEKNGVGKLTECIKIAEPVPIKGIWTVDGFKDKIFNLYKNGREKPNQVKLGDFDRLLSFRAGDLTVVSGIPSHGKSNFVVWLMVLLSSRYGWKWVVFAPENMPEEEMFAMISSMFIGKSFDSEIPQYKMAPVDVEIAYEFIKQHFYFFKFSEADTSVTGICDTIKECVKKYGVNGAIVDPWNCVEHMVANGQNETQYINESLSKFTTIIKTYGIHLFLVAHPTKLKKDETGVYEIPNLYSISGSAHWYNKADNGVIVYRNKDNSVDIHVQKIRWKFVGEVGTVRVNYDFHTGRYAENGKDFLLPYRFWNEWKRMNDEPVPF